MTGCDRCFKYYFYSSFCCLFCSTTDYYRIYFPALQAIPHNFSLVFE
jgi:hypothetical protein